MHAVWSKESYRCVSFRQSRRFSTRYFSLQNSPEIPGTETRQFPRNVYPYWDCNCVRARLGVSGLRYRSVVGAFCSWYFCSCPVYFCTRLLVLYHSSKTCPRRGTYPRYCTIPVVSSGSSHWFVQQHGRLYCNGITSRSIVSELYNFNQGFCCTVQEIVLACTGLVSNNCRAIVLASTNAPAILFVHEYRAFQASLIPPLPPNSLRHAPSWLPGGRQSGGFLAHVSAVPHHARPVPRGAPGNRRVAGACQFFGHEGRP